MSFAGHVLDMISRMKQNEALKSSRRNRYKKVKEVYLEEIGKYPGTNNLTRQNISKEDLRALKNRIKLKLKRERRKNMILTSIIVFLITSVLTILIYNRLKLHM